MTFRLDSVNDHERKCDVCREPATRAIPGGILYCNACYDRLTCVRCPLAPVCRSAYDLYNLDGDCLEDK